MFSTIKAQAIRLRSELSRAKGGDGGHRQIALRAIRDAIMFDERRLEAVAADKLALARFHAAHILDA